MIAELLSAIGSGRSWSMAELSRQLQISEGMIAQMLTDLAHRGYVESDRGATAEDDCPACGGCSRCAAAARLGPDGDTRAWRLTEKGERRVQGRQSWRQRAAGAMPERDVSTSERSVRRER